MLLKLLRVTQKLSLSEKGNGDILVSGQYEPLGYFLS